jgi:soluble lytic murein transglycosylase-like protein
MKPHLLSMLAATAFLASVSPSLAQVFPSDMVDQDARLSAGETTRAVRVHRNRASQDYEAATVGIAPATPFSAPAAVRGGRPYDAMIASHAAANGVPPELVHRVVIRESRYRANARGSGGASGLMQIKLATARSMGYTGSAAGLLDPETNLTYGVRYLAGAYRAAGGSHGRAVSYYASGYRGAARPARAYAMAPRQPAFFTTASAEAEPVALMERPVVHKHKRHHRHHHHRR